MRREDYAKALEELHRDYNRVAAKADPGVDWRFELDLLRFRHDLLRFAYDIESQEDNAAPTDTK